MPVVDVDYVIIVYILMWKHNYFDKLPFADFIEKIVLICGTFATKHNSIVIILKKSEINISDDLVIGSISLNLTAVN